MKITRSWILQHLTPAGGWTQDQVESIGIPWPLVSGWIDRAEGREISEEQRRRFELGLHRSSSGKHLMNSKGEIVAPTEIPDAVRNTLELF